MEQQVIRFIDRVNTEAGTRVQEGKVGLDTLKVRAIVRDEPEMAELVVKLYTQAAQDDPQRLKMAYLLATAYYIEFNDDKLLRHIETIAGDVTTKVEMAEYGGELKEFAIGGRSENAVRILVIPHTDVEAGDISEVSRIFGDLEADPEQASSLQGRVAFEFKGYSQDPRPDFLIPAIRRYVQRLDAEFPYFLYYLNTDLPNQINVYTFSLLKAEDFRLMPGSYTYHGTALDIAQVLVSRLNAIDEFCQITGVNTVPVLQAILQHFPAEVSGLIKFTSD